MGVSARRRGVVRGAGLAVAALGLTSAAEASPRQSDGRRLLRPPRSCAVPPRYLGLDAYRQWDTLSYLELGDRVSGQSTADPAGTNADAGHVLRTLPNGGRVLFDQTGPGIVTFLRMQETAGAPWMLQVDGRPVVTIHPDDLGQLSPRRAPADAFPYPLSLDVAETAGSSIVATAIPFVHRLTWTAQGRNGNFYALYRRLPYGTPLPVTSSAPVGDVVGLLRQAGGASAPAHDAGQRGSITLPPRRETTLVTLTGGPRQVRALQVRVAERESVAAGNARLRIYWDGAATPAVDAPLKVMAGDGAGVYHPRTRALVQGWPVGITDDGRGHTDFDLYWPMPFHTTARVTLSSTTPARLTGLEWAVRDEPFMAPSNWWGTFHATYTRVPTPVPGRDMTFLDVTGSGRIVGMVVNFGVVGPTLEGDPHIFLDDSNTPQIQATGTEEWGLGGDYWNGGRQTSLPLGGLPSSTANPPGATVDGAALYRFLIADSIPFNRRAIVRWEHGGVDTSTESYRAAVFWYGTPAQTAVRSEDLRVGDATSRSRHAYRSPQGHSYRLIASDEYAVHAPLRSAVGVATTTISTFRLALDPRNVGAFLRRAFDYGAPDQRAAVFVDGRFAGIWYSAGSFGGAGVDGHVRRWREEEFPLPAALTSGKSAVTIQVRVIPTTDPSNRAWTEFEYQMYSLVLPGCAATATSHP